MRKNDKNSKIPSTVKDDNSLPSKLLPETGFIRIKQVLELIPVCAATLWNGVKSGRFPKPIKNFRCTFWRVEDIRAFIENAGK